MIRLFLMVTRLFVCWFVGLFVDRYYELEVTMFNTDYYALESLSLNRLLDCHHLLSASAAQLI